MYRKCPKIGVYITFIFDILIVFSHFFQLMGQVVSGDYIYHTARKGETVWGISQAYGISPEVLIKENPLLKERVLKEGDILKIPVKKSSYFKEEGVSPQFWQNNDTLFHIVKSGETFYKISKHYDVPIERIKEWNPDKETLRAQDTIRIIKKPPEGKSFIGIPALEDTLESHIVKEGETFYSIAKFYNVNVDVLIAINKPVKPLELKAGMQIRLPIPKKSKEKKELKEDSLPGEPPFLLLSSDTILNIWVPVYLQDTSSFEIDDETMRILSTMKLTVDKYHFMYVKPLVKIININSYEFSKDTNRWRGFVFLGGRTKDVILKRNLNFGENSLCINYGKWQDIKKNPCKALINIAKSDEEYLKELLNDLRVECERDNKCIIIVAGREFPFAGDLQVYKSFHFINYFWGKEKEITAEIDRDKKNKVILWASKDFFSFLIGYIYRLGRNYQVEIFIPWNQLELAEPIYLVNSQIILWGFNHKLYGFHSNTQDKNVISRFFSDFYKEEGYLPTANEYLMARTFIGLTEVIGRKKNNLYLEEMMDQLSKVLEKEGIELRKDSIFDFTWKLRWHILDTLSKIINEIQKY